MEGGKWQVLAKEDIFSNKYRTLQYWLMRDPSGEERKYSIELEHDVVVIFALTPDNQVLVLRQYFLAHEEKYLCLVGGMSEPGEQDRIVKEELREETGYEAGEWVYLGSSIRSKYNTGDIHHYIAKDVVKVGEQELGPGEDIEVDLMSLEDFKQALYKGEVKDIMVEVCAYKALAYLEKNK